MVIRRIHNRQTRSSRESERPVESAATFSDARCGAVFPYPISPREFSAGGDGLNLQKAASCCINVDLPWNPAVLEQRIGRIHRLGQKRPIDVYNLGLALRLARYSHGASGAGSDHRPRRAVRASSSKVCRAMSVENLRYHQAMPWRTS